MLNIVNNVFLLLCRAICERIELKLLRANLAKLINTVVKFFVCLLICSFACPLHFFLAIITMFLVEYRYIIFVIFVIRKKTFLMLSTNDDGYYCTCSCTCTLLPTPAVAA